MNLLKAFLVYLFLLGMFGTVLGIISYTMDVSTDALAEYIYFPNVLQIGQLTFTGIVVGTIIFLGVGIIMEQKEVRL